MTYDELLKTAPPQDSPDFLTFLRRHNKVVADLRDWLIIENTKYNKPDRPWLTAFAKDSKWFGIIDLVKWTEIADMSEWYWIKKPRSLQSVPGRFHIHLTLNPKKKEGEQTNAV